MRNGNLRWKLLLLAIALLLLLVPVIVKADFDPGDPAQRGPEAVKIAALRENPAPATWGYDMPYTYAYGTGIPYYVGHNDGMPSGDIYENPATYPYGVSEPGVIYGDPEYSMLVNYGYSFPFHGPTSFVVTGPVTNSLFPPFAFAGPQPTG